MIFYFSGTGNSKWVAEQVAKQTDDRAYDICDTQMPNIENEAFIGLVFPIYAWGAAEPMLEFAKSLPVTKAFTYGICTCGADAGLAMKKLSNIYHLDSSYSVTMPNNYIVGTDLEDNAAILKKLDNARIQIPAIVTEIQELQKVYRVSEGSAAFIKSNFATIGFNKFARNTKPFYADENCISCGQCSKNCPVKTISMQNSKPVWGQKCYQCMRCINACPQKSIQYGKITTVRKRYMLDNFYNQE